MSSPVALPSFASGEMSPSLLGHIDLARLKSSAMTMRNMFIRFQGGAASRAGTSFAGYSKQTGRSFPPRLIPFQFSINQGLALEFGNQYMRVIFDGALVTENPLVVIGATNAKPCAITVAAFALQSATAINSGVVSSYAPGDLITLAGGTFSIPAQVQVSATVLRAATPLAPGSGYAPGDTITLAGGIHSSAAAMTVTDTQVVSASIAAGGTGGTNGLATVTGTTGTGTKFQAIVLIVGGAISAISSISVAGDYTVNPTNLNAEPVTGGGLTGATLKISMGVKKASVSAGGVYTANPAGLSFTQASTSGSGTGATFALGIFGINSLTVANAGAYTVAPSSPTSQASTTGTGSGATFSIVMAAANAFAVGDWIFLSGIGGMTQLNGTTAVIASIPIGGEYVLNDVFGNPIDTTDFGAFTSDGSVARIYTLPTPYAEQDLEWLKFIQSADVVSLTCVNQETGTEYPPYDLSRIADDNWSLAQLNMTPTVAPPTNVSGFGTTIPYGAGANASYAYAVTAVNPADGTESIASNIGYILNGVDIAATAGTITLNWTGVQGVNQYNIYKAQPSYQAAIINPNTTPVSYTYQNCPPPPVGSLMGFVGSAYGTQFIDSNVLPDFTQVPPTHQNPFARGQITGFQATSGGSDYTTASVTINTLTGSGAVIVPAIVNGQVVAYIVQDAGQGYAASDTATIVGDGSGAAAVLTIGAQQGTYPGAVSYFQERRVYANTLNNPDTYFMSQPGSFKNFDTRIPVISTDAITGSPWSVQVNGIQWMIQIPPGLLVMTGLSAWILAGAGSFATNVQPISPADQTAIPQAFTGVSATVPPTKINYTIIFVTSKGNYVYELPYQLYALSEPIDLTEFSAHLFQSFQIREIAWCEQPYKLYWAVRNDGTLLSMTYLKEQKISGWSRSDTQGLFQSVCSVVEPPVDAAYLAVQRTIGPNTAYFLERMDNRLWTGVESTWCVDCGLNLPQPQPAATLNASSPLGIGSISGVTGLVGGTGYSPSTFAQVIDKNGLGPGAGAVPVLTIAGGVITNITFSSAGAGYVSPALVIIDPSNQGSGASAQCTLNTSVTFTASAPVFSPSNVGSVIRMGGGIATITGYTSPTVVTGQLTTPISAIQPNSGGLVQAQASGSWTMTVPITKVTGLNHLIGATVTGLADGNVIPPQTVAADGSITLSGAASAITVGLAFQAQLQSVYLDALVNDVAGQRKKVSMATVRLEASRGAQVGSNQIDGSTVSPPILAPVWQNLDNVPDLVPPPFGSNVTPLWTGDVRLPVSGGFGKPGQVAVQQSQPLPLNVLAIIPEILEGDNPEQKASPRQQKKAA